MPDMVFLNHPDSFPTEETLKKLNGEMLPYMFGAVYSWCDQCMDASLFARITAEDENRLMRALGIAGHIDDGAVIWACFRCYAPSFSEPRKIESCPTCQGGLLVYGFETRHFPEKSACLTPSPT